MSAFTFAGIAYLQSPRLMATKPGFPPRITNVAGSLRWRTGTGAPAG
jgi:hypothetical protein